MKITRFIIIALLAGVVVYKVHTGFEPTIIPLEQIPVPHSDWVIKIEDEVPWGLIGPAIQGEDYVTAINSRTGEEVSLMHIKELYDVDISYEEPSKLIIAIQQGYESLITKGHDVFGGISVIYRQVPDDPGLMRVCDELWAKHRNSGDQFKTCRKSPYDGRLITHYLKSNPSSQWQENYLFWLNNHNTPKATEWCIANVGTSFNRMKECPDSAEKKYGVRQIIKGSGK